MRRSLLASLLLHAPLLAVVVPGGRRAAAPEKAPVVAFRSTVASVPAQPDSPPPEPPFPTRPDLLEEEPEITEPAPVEFEAARVRFAPPASMERAVPSVRLARPLPVREPPPETQESHAEPAPATAESRAPRPASCAAPAYPALARRMGQQGTVRLRLRIDRDGKVAGAEVIESSGSSLLDRAALIAARAWRFEPAERDGRPVAAELVQPVEFRLR